MHLSRLRLTNFRNFSHLDLELPLGLTVLYGGNAQGKTGILEAIYLMCIGRSFRALNDHELMRWDAANEDTILSGAFQRGESRLQVIIGYKRPPAPGGPSQRRSIRREIRVNGSRRTTPQLVGLVNAVLFSADDIDLVYGPPSGRRRFMDIMISQADPLYFRSLQRYTRVVQQRNRLLKALQDHRANEDELEFWDQELVQHGSLIVQRRGQAMANLCVLAREQHFDLTESAEDLLLEYKPSISLRPAQDRPVPETSDLDDMARQFTAALAKSNARDKSTGTTGVGPHRDDVAISANGVDMTTYASRGQARTTALSMKLAEAEYLTAAKGERPLALLDDVLSELDWDRRRKTLEKAAYYQQVVMTTADRGVLSDFSGVQTAFYEVRAGAVRPESQPDRASGRASIRTDEVSG